MAWDKLSTGIFCCFNIGRKTDIFSLDLDAITERLDSGDFGKGQSGLEEITKDVEDLQNNIEQLEQYSRKNNVILHTVSEYTGDREGEVDCKTLILGVLNNHSEEQFSVDDISEAHRFGFPTPSGKRPRPIIIRFHNTNSKIRSPPVPRSTEIKRLWNI